MWVCVSLCGGLCVCLSICGYVCVCVYVSVWGHVRMCAGAHGGERFEILLGLEL